ncbi:alpha-amylase family protein [Aliivibrio finisterrensis]|uniref:Alpha-amylase n=1 Tax=Aliivibrio finisterrensis TaxID=511998 RepID=A0A6N6RX66_9GAMM|nr:alpha-amylase family protein [Aliivibrio finisterrensis]KAB2826376.1 alpha-amylase [Aliivibrio finisterrensis]
MDQQTQWHSVEVPAMSNVILHAFDWNYDYITEQAELIASLGYRSVLVSPAMKSLRLPSGSKWWQRYQPQDYRLIDNPLGNTLDFKRMVERLAELSIWVYADVVFNHMANESDIRADLEYPNQWDREDYARNPEKYEALKLFGDLSEPLFTESDFVEAFGIENWNDKWEVQNGRISGGPHDPGLPTLADNAHVIEQQRSYLKALKQIGVKGFRIDAAKHMSLEHLSKVWDDEITHDIHIFGEIITDGGATKEEYETFLNPYLKETKLGAYDFPLFNTLYQALEKDASFTSLIDPYIYGMAMSPLRAITFATTHDIPNNQVFQSLVMSEANEWLAHAYLFGRDGGIALIYSELDVSGIKNGAGEPRWKDEWYSERMATLIAFHHDMYGEPQKHVAASDDHLIFERGESGIVAINKSAHNIEVNMAVKSDVVWLERTSHNYYAPQQGNLRFFIPANSYLLFSR